jgi:hypothetical protein
MQEREREREREIEREREKERGWLLQRKMSTSCSSSRRRKAGDRERVEMNIPTG